MPPLTQWSHPFPFPFPTSTSEELGPTQHPGSVTSAPSSQTTVSSSRPTASGNGTEGPCASVSRLVASFTRASPSATPTVPAQLAYECINTVPFNQSAAGKPTAMRYAHARNSNQVSEYEVDDSRQGPKRVANADDHIVALMDSIRPYLDWQTTIEYLADPPAEYASKVQAPYDFWADWDDIYQRVMHGAYTSEYAFGWDLYRSFQKAHDGHFVYYPDSVTLIFSYGRTEPLVSVSGDGTSIPEVYAYSDVLASSFGNISYTPSPLATIDGQDSTEWLLNFSEYGSLQDPDALWNNMFYLLAQVSLGPTGTGAGTFAGGGRGRWVYPGACTTMGFENGTTLTIDNFAKVQVPFDGITSGEDLYRTYFTPDPEDLGDAESLATMTSSSSSVASSTSSSATSTSTIPAPGYPTPLVREKNNLNSGYFLEGEGYNDVAVLSVPSFVGSVEDERAFQAVNTYTINQAVAQNKSKLIIDVSANGGGTILQGYDLFKQLFPHILPYGATRFRAHEALDLIGQEVSHFSGLVPRSLKTNETVRDWVSTVFNYRTDADVNYEPFDSWAEKFGPHAYGPAPDNFTSLIRWNLSDILTPENSGGIDVSGYLNRSNITTQPFRAENIVIVYDGYCASTCTIFSELMRQQAGVRTIALGGRPNQDPIQAVGGVKGTNDFPYSYILAAAAFPFEYQYLHDSSYYDTTALGEYNDLAILRSTDAVINSRDGIREGDDDQTPLQFRYEAADCRIFYTPEMAVDQTAAWKTVADTAFRGISHCVAGNFSSAAGSGMTKRRKRSPARKQGVRRDLDGREHYDVLRDGVWTGMGGVTLGGDGFMYP
ncbi:hypothetical protein D0859_13440 [Hortaea werneckii]|uniref:CPAF-like PDZ domain-containing protein n=1 Tax=Hortaea werneckii TaxID=91943 RepID=A0A3M7IAR4_HORWE|nr:hypothetical protein D0859_13440 [Hortaea werneckii]